MSKVCCVGVCEDMTWDEAKEFIIKKHDRRRHEEELRREQEKQKVCCVGVCEGMTWDEAKEFIIKKHNLSFWWDWVHRVKWR
jgi:ATP-dependent helicase YprA (DUF1998 family)